MGKAGEEGQEVDPFDDTDVHLLQAQPDLLAFLINQTPVATPTTPRVTLPTHTAVSTVWWAVCTSTSVDTYSEETTDVLVSLIQYQQPPTFLCVIPYSIRSHQQ